MDEIIKLQILRTISKVVEYVSVSLFAAFIFFQIILTANIYPCSGIAAICRLFNAITNPPTMVINGTFAAIFLILALICENNVKKIDKILDNKKHL